MVNYSLGKIYKIEPITGGEEGDVYIGSTTAPLLSRRMAQHRCEYKRWIEEQTEHGTTSIIVFEKYGIENCQIVLLENVNAANKDELFARERYWIQSQKCVNKNISGRKLPEYREENKESITAYKKRWCQENKVTLKAYKSQWYHNNKERLKKLN